MRILILAPAKSGSTVLQQMLATALGYSELILEEPADKLVNPPKDCVAKILYEHNSDESILRAASGFDYKILLVRDPRDNLVSRLLYSLANNPTLLADDRFLEGLLNSLREKEACPALVSLHQIVERFPDVEGHLGDKTCRILYRYADFARRYWRDWQVVFYEDLVVGNLRGLQMTLGCTIPIVEVPVELKRVTRTKRAGDWVNWFTADDIELLKDRIDPLLSAFGYDQDWRLPEAPVIEPRHGSEYLTQLVRERREHFSLPPWRETAALVCNICGGTEFVAGPNGRMAENANPPMCRRCGSLERQRAVRALSQAIPIGFFHWRRCLQVGGDIGLDSGPFRTYEVARLFNAASEVDLAKPSGSYDFIAFGHLLEYVREDRGVFADMVRLLSPSGVLLVCFYQPLTRPFCEHIRETPGPYQIWHKYGMNLKEYFQVAERGLGVMVAEVRDPGTGLEQTVHMFCKDNRDLVKVREWLREWRSISDAVG